MSTLTPEQQAFLSYTNKQIQQYSYGVNSSRLNRNILTSDDYTSQVSNTVTRTFFDRANTKLLSATINRDENVYTVDNITLNESQLSNELAKLVTSKLKSHNINHTVTTKLFELHDERKVLVYLFLKYHGILNTFSTQNVYNGLSNSTTEFNRDNSIQQCKQYLIKIFREGNLTWYPFFIENPNNDNISNLILSDYLQSTLLGGRTKKTSKTSKSNHTQLKRFAQKVVVKGQERQVYVGPRGGKYIKMQNKTISLAQLKK